VTRGPPLSEAAAAARSVPVVLHRPREVPDPAARNCPPGRRPPDRRPAGRRQESYSWRPLPGGQWPGNDDQINVHAHQFGSQVREPFRLALRVAVLNGDILAFDQAKVA